jgi:hypothetical protein
MGWSRWKSCSKFKSGVPLPEQLWHGCGISATKSVSGISGRRLPNPVIFPYLMIGERQGTGPWIIPHVYWLCYRLMILAFKLIVTPFFIGAVTLAGRKWGPTVSGLLMGLPLTSALISIFLAIQYGAAFAVRSASGNLAGQASVCIFCLAYGLSARKYTWITATSRDRKLQPDCCGE